jgi:hypothetical protein
VQTKHLGRERYNFEAKACNFEKRQWNRYVCDAVASLYAYHRSVGGNPGPRDVRGLVLDAASLETYRHLLEHTPLRACNVDVISRDTAFRTGKTKCIVNDAARRKFTAGSSGAFVTGEMHDWLVRIPVESRYYDVVVLDFCSTFHNAGTQACVRALFERHLIEDVSVLVATFAHRDNHGTEHDYQGCDSAEWFIVQVAREFGYRVHAIHVHFGSDVYSLFFKVVHSASALDKKTGYKLALKSGENIYSWPQRVL